jgi:hypothetical protein
MEDLLQIDYRLIRAVNLFKISGPRLAVADPGRLPGALFVVLLEAASLPVGSPN